MSDWQKIALVIWVPILILGASGGGVYLYVHHKDQVKQQKTEAQKEAQQQVDSQVEACQNQVHARWDPLIQTAQENGLPYGGDQAEEQAQLNQC